MASYFIGQGGSVKYTPTGSSAAATTICVESWTIELRNDVQDVTTTCSGGFIDRIDGCTDATLTFTGFYDSTAPILTGVQPGYELEFEADIGSTIDKITANFIVQTVNIENPAKSTVKFTVTAVSTGSITYA